MYFYFYFSIKNWSRPHLRDMTNNLMNEKLLHNINICDLFLNKSNKFSLCRIHRNCCLWMHLINSNNSRKYCFYTWENTEWQKLKRKRIGDIRILNLLKIYVLYVLIFLLLLELISKIIILEAENSLTLLALHMDIYMKSYRKMLFK